MAKANRDFVAAAVKRLYGQLSDLEISSQPKRWQDGMCPEIDALCASWKSFGRQRNWWQIVDQLADRGLFREAMVAQRYASPLLEDLARIITGNDFRQDFGEDTKEANLRILGAIEQFDLFQADHARYWRSKDLLHRPQ